MRLCWFNCYPGVQAYQNPDNQNASMVALRVSEDTE